MASSDRHLFGIATAFAPKPRSAFGYDIVPLGEGNRQWQAQIALCHPYKTPAGNTGPPVPVGLALFFLFRLHRLFKEIMDHRLLASHPIKDS
eukprot:scaffold2781_cov69-Attheya_sp.AAC.1